MTHVVNRIAACAERAFGRGIAIFSPGAEAARIADWQLRFGQRLPQSYLSFLSRSDGQNPRCPIVFPPGQLKLLSGARAVELWTELKPLADEDDTYFEITGDDGCVRAVLYDVRRIPVAYDEGGLQYLFIDYIPGPKGRMGQLISNPAEATFEVVASSFGAWLESIAYGLEAGNVRLVQASAEFGGEYRFSSGDGHLLTCAECRALASKIA